MTVLVGVLCDDGVVVGSDSAVTFSAGVSQQTIEQTSGGVKVHVVGGKILVATTGAVGLAQRFLALLQGLHGKDELRQADPVKQATLIAEQTINEFKRTMSVLQHQPQVGWGLGCLLGMPDSDRPELFEFDSVQFHPERKGDRDRDGAYRTPRFGSMGSGQMLADPLLAFIGTAFWRDTSPKLVDAKLAVGWVLHHAISHNTGGVGGAMQMGALSKVGTAWKAEIVDTSEIPEQIEDLNRYIGKYKDQIASR